MKKKLLLISVVDQESYVKKNFVSPVTIIKFWQPMALGIIAEITPGDWDVEIIDENFEVFQYKEADLVGISSYTTSINKAYRIAQQYKKNKIPVVIGGMHVSFFPDEAEKYVDTVAIGKAEGLWTDILNDFNNSCLKRRYYSNPDAQVCFRVNRKVLKKYNYSIGNILTSIGCTNNCDFCNIPAFQDYKVHYRDLDDTVREIQELEQDYFLFDDDNFFGSTDKQRKRAVELLKKMIDAKINKKWWCVTSVDISKYPDVLWLAHKAGCVIAFVGMESFDQDELKSFNKHSNKEFALDSYKSVIDVFHKNKIAVMSSFICGGDHETPESMMQRGLSLRKTRIDNFILRFLTPLPKTRLYERLEQQGRLLYTSFPEDWIYYNLATITYKSDHGTTDDFYRAYQKTHELMFAPYKGLIKDPFKYKFFQTVILTKSIRIAIDSHVFLSFCIVGEYQSKFWKILFKFRRPKTKFNW
ncbi:MAG: cobalamin-dependent protein [Bacteroidales bacterium]|jgi:radical SAM superfamily enzyme YgiQ (UPF0313 family)|nr:cobalamin-dependent protein [Bacteroidales bacterium]